jgi:hypothetical protein
LRAEALGSEFSVNGFAVVVEDISGIGRLPNKGSVVISEYAGFTLKEESGVLLRASGGTLFDPAHSRHLHECGHQYQFSHLGTLSGERSDETRRGMSYHDSVCWSRQGFLDGGGAYLGTYSALPW